MSTHTRVDNVHQVHMHGPGEMHRVKRVKIQKSRQMMVRCNVRHAKLASIGKMHKHAVSAHLEPICRTITQNVLRVLPYTRNTAVICMSKYRACRGMNRTRFHLQTHAITNSFQCQQHPCAGAAGAHCFKTHSHQQMRMPYHATTRCDITWTAQRAPVYTVQ